MAEILEPAVEGNCSRCWEALPTHKAEFMVLGCPVRGLEPRRSHIEAPGVVELGTSFGFDLAAYEEEIEGADGRDFRVLNGCFGGTVLGAAYGDGLMALTEGVGVDVNADLGGEVQGWH